MSRVPLPLTVSTPQPWGSRSRTAGLYCPLVSTEKRPTERTTVVIGFIPSTPLNRVGGCSVMMTARLSYPPMRRPPLSLMPLSSGDLGFGNQYPLSTSVWNRPPAAVATICPQLVLFKAPNGKQSWGGLGGERQGLV